MRKKIAGAVMVFFAALSCSMGQTTFSPYTINGIGDLSGMNLANNFGQGEIGIASPSVLYINNINPAHLAYNRLSSFQMAIGGESRSIASQNSTQNSGTGGLNYMLFAFPVIKTKWGTSFGFMPYSSVNYSVTTSDFVPDTEVPVSYNFNGEGGITQAFFSNGFRLGKRFTVGVKASFLFGSVKNETITDLGDDEFSAPLSSVLSQTTDYRGWKFSGGLNYRKKIADDKFINFGLVYDNSKDLRSNRFIRLERRQITSSSIPGDTLVNNEKGFFSLPSEIGLGFSYEKSNFFTVAIDVRRKSWNQFANAESTTEEFRNTLEAGMGIEIIPDYTSVSSYFKRIRYRFGFNFKQVPYVIGGNSINDFGINFGWSLPFNSVSGMDFAFKLGQRGTKSNDLIRERYFKFIFGATINDRWFVRRKFN